MEHDSLPNPCGGHENIPGRNEIQGSEGDAKMIGVDTAKYMLEIDGRSDEIHTGGDGCWGNEVELYRRVGNQRVSDAMIISVAIREETDFERMRQMARYFFPELQQVDRGVKKKKRGDTAR